MPRPENKLLPHLACLCVAGFVFAAPVIAQEDEQEKLENLEQEIEATKARQQELNEQAEQAANEAQGISTQIVTLAREIQAQEDKATGIENELMVLNRQIADKTTDIQESNKDMAHTLAALQRLSQRPPEFVIIRPAEAVETVRSASLLTTALPEIKKRTDAIRADVEELNDMKAELSVQKLALSENLDQLQTRNNQLEKLQTNKRSLYASLKKDAVQESQKIERLARQAKDLESLIASLEKELENEGITALPTPSIPENTSFAKAKGSLPFPARGNLGLRFGDKIPAGTAKGIRILTRPGAQVIAPFDGRVIYAGPFRAYGNLLIIAHGDGYHTLLAGLNNINSLVGQWVLAGEPVGSMPKTRLATTSGQVMAPSPELYLELRRNGEPVNPLPWLKK